jgi:hypothetical protein
MLVLAPEMARAGGAIGWANAVNEFSTEGIAVGSAAVILGIIAVGAILMFGITGLITTVVMVCLGGALMANADAIAGALFAGGAGGGSIRDVVIQPPSHGADLAPLHAR